MLSEVAAFLVRCMYPFAAHLADKTVIAGIRILEIDPRGGNAALRFDRIRAAFALIQHYDPKLLSRMRGDVRDVVTAPLRSGGGEYWRHLRTVMLDADAVVKHTPEALAMIIVHEATHARLHKSGVDHSKLEKIERICVAAEIRFIQKLPETANLVVGARRKLATRYWERQE